MFNRYYFAVQTVTKSLHALHGLLHQAQEWVRSENLDESALLQARLYDDMFPLVKQIQVATDNAKGMVSRLAQVENPVFEDIETTFAELINRIEKTLAFIEPLREEDFAKADDVQVVFGFMPGKYQKASEYVGNYAIPNFYFHYVTAYDILRSRGMKIGKMDFIGGVPLYDLDQ